MTDRSKAVLLVEDDEGTAELERRALVRSGFQVRIVGGVREAIEILARESFCAVLLDYNLPDGEPWRVAEAARGKAPRVPVILVTGAGGEAVAEGAIHHHVDDYFRKSENVWEQLPGAVDRVARLAQVEDLLARKDAFLRTIAANCTDIIALSGLDGVIKYISPACRDLYGYAPEELEGTRGMDHVHPEDRERIQGLLGDIKASKGFVARLRRRRKDGTYLWIEVTVNGLPDPETGEVSEVAAIARDVTEQVEAQRIKDQFVSIVNHELRTPLTSIKGALGLALAGVGGELPAEVRALLEIAAQNSDRLVRIVNDILDLERLQAGKLEYHLSVEDLMTVVRWAMEDLQPFAAPSGIRLDLETSLPGARVRTDPDRLLQVLTNLLSNAVKFSPPGGIVSLRVFRKGSDLRMEIQDRGPGIPDGFKRRIFERFAQSDTTVRMGRGGSGLGLSIAKSMVEEMGGRIGFDSVEGAGTTFFVEFPEWTGA